MKRQAIMLAVGAALVLSSAAAFAAAKADDGSIHACRIKRHGLVRVPPTGKSCKRTETELNWNVQGPAGPAGPTGPAGPQGPKGDSGAASVSAFTGTRCTTFEGEQGVVSLDVTATDLIVFQCDGPSGDGGDRGGGGGGAGAANLVINEIDYDQVGSDTGGFVEIRNDGDAQVTLDGIALVFVNGGDSTEYDRVALIGTLAAGAYLVVPKDAQNGAPDGVALIDTASATLLDALSYEGSITAAVIDGHTYSLVEGNLLPATVVDSNTIDASLIRTSDEELLISSNDQDSSRRLHSGLEGRWQAG